MALTVRKEEMSALRDEWVALLERQSEPVPFAHPTWQRVWLDDFQNGRELLTLAVRDGDELVGVAPLLRDNGCLSFVGHYSICDYMDFVVAPDRGHEVFPALFEALSHEQWSDLDLRGLHEGSSTLEDLPAAAQAAGLAIERETEAVAPGVELPAGWEEYVASLDKKARHELRRKLRRLDSAGELELRVYTSPEDIETHLPLLLRFMVESRKDKANFLSEQMASFFHRMAQVMSREGLLRLYELEMDGRPVASVLCFDLKGRLYMYNSGYDPEHSALAVGLASKALCLREAIESGYQRIDFLRGHEPYKYDLGGKDRTIYRVVVRRG
jgi:CelD/BcsL family acetyltransferase involved in cellulose biosynthesis